MAIDVKHAVDLARQYLSDVLSVPVHRVLLEEVERSTDGKFWLITFSYPGPTGSAMHSLVGLDRQYKIVKLNAHSGDFVSIKIRSLATAS